MIEWANDNAGFSAFACAGALLVVTAVYALITWRTLSAMKRARDREESRWRVDTVASFVSNARTASALYQDSVQPADHLLDAYCNQGISSAGFLLARESVASALDRSEDYRQQSKGMENRLIFVYGSDSDILKLVGPISKRLDRQRDAIRRCVRWVDKQSPVSNDRPDPTGAKDGVPDDKVAQLETLVRSEKVSVKSRGRIVSKIPK